MVNVATGLSLVLFLGSAAAWWRGHHVGDELIRWTWVPHPEGKLQFEGVGVRSGGGCVVFTRQVVVIEERRRDED